ncbi:MAG: 50S ribosomal protein L29 [bacterium]
MKYSELKIKPVTELKKLLAENQARLRELRFKISQGQHKDVREIRSTRRTIAQLHTFLNNQPDKKV